MRSGLLTLVSAAVFGAVALTGMTEARGAEPKDGGTLTIAKAADAVSLDPYVATAGPSVWVYSNIYDTLVIEDRELGVQPGLAESWEQPSPTTWRFHLRKGVKFHDGTPFNAEAVKFTFDRALNPDKPARGLSMAGPISGVKVVDAHTVDISTPEPFGPFLQAMSEVFVFGIISPTAVAKHGEEYGRNPVGTGPFKFESWEKNSQVVLARNEDYWGGKPHLEKLVFKVIPEASSQVIAFGANEVDGIMSPEASLLPRLQADTDAAVYQVPGLRLLHVGMNTKRPITSDVRIRRALNHAINRKALAEQLLKGTATPAEGYLPRQVFGFHDAGFYNYDPEKAKALFAEAGWTPGSDGKLQKDGQPLSVSFWGYTGRDPNSRLIGEAVQGELERAGVTVNLRIWDYSQLGSALWKEMPKEGPHATEYDLFMLGWTTITGDADFTLYGTLSDISIPPEGLNATFWAPDEYMAAIRKGRFSTDPDERKAAYKKAQEMLYENAVWIPLVVLNQVVAFKKNVKNYEPHPVEYYMLLAKDVWLDK
jgi:peptide/nickel transport system substrate-binding protein